MFILCHVEKSIVAGISDQKYGTIFFKQKKELFTEYKKIVYFD